MAKKKAAAGASKSKHVRDYLGRNPDAGPKQVVNELAAQGIDVSMSLVTLVKSKLRRKRPAKRKVARISVAPRPVTAARRPSADSLSADDLFEAKKLVDQLGGLEQVRRALETLEQLR